MENRAKSKDLVNVLYLNRCQSGVVNTLAGSTNGNIVSPARVTRVRIYNTGQVLNSNLGLRFHHLLYLYVGQG